MEMHWNEPSIGGMPDPFKARRSICKAYDLGFIDWDTFNKALEKIARVKHGDWMFKSPRDNAKE